MIFLERTFFGIGIVSHAIMFAMIWILKKRLAPRTREGYYHYAGGVEVSWSLTSAISQ
jgi:hypothetical protein